MEVTGPPKDIDVAVWDSCWRTVGFSVSPNHPSRCLLMKLPFSRQFLWFWWPSELA